MVTTDHSSSSQTATALGTEFGDTFFKSSFSLRARWCLERISQKVTTRSSETCRPTLGGSRRRETAQRSEIRASTALGGTSRSAACARECSRERVREPYESYLTISISTTEEISMHLVTRTGCHSVRIQTAASRQRSGASRF